MFNQISMEASPELKHPFNFFLFAFAGLCLTALYLISTHAVLIDRWDNRAIVLTHLFTLMFLLPVALGALTQLIPVLFGITLDFSKNLRPLFFILPTGAMVFAYFFHTMQIEANITLAFPLLMLWGTLIHLAVSMMRGCLQSYRQNKNFMHLSLFFAFGNLIIGLLLSALLVAAHYGVPVPHFRPGLSNLHLTFMMVGFFFNLIHAIAYHVIPMFFVTASNSPLLSRTILTVVNGALLFKLMALPLSSLSPVADYVISVGLILFAVSLLRQLARRKRKKRDPVVFLWMVFAVNLCLSCIAIPALTAWEVSEKWTVIGGLHLMLGIFLPLILAMLMKIIPFLHWMHLSRLSLQTGAQTRLPHMKDYVSDQSVWILGVLLFTTTLSLFLPTLLPAGLLLLVLALFAGFQLLNAQKIYQIHLQEMKKDH